MASNNQERDRERLIEVLQRELEASREREARLLGLLERLQPQRPRGREASIPHAQPQHSIRKEILALLQEHPEGLPRRELESTIGTDRNLSDVLQGMTRAGLIVRVAPAVFALAPGANTPQA